MPRMIDADSRSLTTVAARRAARGRRPAARRLGLCAAALWAGLAAAQAQQTVVVEPGDSLSEIALRVLGDGSRWPEICAANTAVLGENCDVLLIGTELVVPGGEDQAATPQLPALDGDYVVRLGRAEAETLQVPDGISVERRGDALVASGSVSEPSSAGRTAGLSLRLPDSLELAASGRTVRVSLLAAAADGAAVAIAYSTSEVGNSGWRTLTLSATPAVVSFDYAVPQGKPRGGDYVGILPDPQATGQSVTLYGLSVEVVD